MSLNTLLRKAIVGKPRRHLLVTILKAFPIVIINAYQHFNRSFNSCSGAEKALTPSAVLWRTELN